MLPRVTSCAVTRLINSPWRGEQTFFKNSHVLIFLSSSSSTEWNVSDYARRGRNRFFSPVAALDEATFEYHANLIHVYLNNNQDFTTQSLLPTFKFTTNSQQFFFIASTSCEWFGNLCCENYSNGKLFRCFEASCMCAVPAPGPTYRILVLCLKLSIATDW